VAEFVALCHSEFAFLFELGFKETPSPGKEHVNPYQVRFSNEKVAVTIEGAGYGFDAEIFLEDASGIRVPEIVFVPPSMRPSRRERKRDAPDQRNQVAVGASRIRDYCHDVLTGDMARFYERAAEWQRITKRDLSYRQGKLP
jgi:hypothetical protein